MALIGCNVAPAYPNINVEPNSKDIAKTVLQDAILNTSAILNFFIILNFYLITHESGFI